MKLNNNYLTRQILNELDIKHDQRKSFLMIEESKPAVRTIKDLIQERKSEIDKSYTFFKQLVGNNKGLEPKQLKHHIFGFEDNPDNVMTALKCLIEETPNEKEYYQELINEFEL